ncbi:MAG: 50S ribosomal protein L27 [Saprospiraceae bacterium]|nr:50S ribosomal protein L27 [Saprospiraceae bacterium]
MLSHILLNCSIMDNLPTALALCLIPFLLGWLAARAYYKVGWLRDQITELSGRVSTLTEELTDTRMKLAAAEADSEAKAEQIRKLRSDLIMCEGERMALREQAANAPAAGAGKKAAVAAVAASFMFAGKKWKADDLKIVEGIGPKIEEMLHDAGIKTWKALSKTSADDLKDILEAAGPNFNIHDPSTWAQQAGLADQGKWDELKKWQDELNAGKE